MSFSKEVPTCILLCKGALLVENKRTRVGAHLLLFFKLLSLELRFRVWVRINVRVRARVNSLG